MKKVRDRKGEEEDGGGGSGGRNNMGRSGTDRNGQRCFIWCAPSSRLLFTLFCLPTYSTSIRGLARFT